MSERGSTGRPIGPASSVAIALALTLLANPFGARTAAQASEKPTKPSPRRTSQQSSQVPSSLLRAVRASVNEEMRVKIVRSPSRGVVRIALDLPLVKETDYRSALVAGCREIVRSKAAAAVTSIEVVTADQRQGYVYRPAKSCSDVLAADEERRRLAIVPGTTVFRARR